VPVTWGYKLRWLPRALRVTALVLVVVALARPQGPAGARETMAEGIDIVLALDISSSMRAADFKPKDRATVAKRVVADFVRKRSNDRIGLVVFGREAFTQCPLTLDYSVLHNLLEELQPLENGSDLDGTAIGNAVATAVNRLHGSEAKSRIVILLTDGDNNSGNVTPQQAAEVAKVEGVRVYTILAGSGGRVPIPVKGRFGQVHYVERDMPVNPELLQEIAKTSGGRFYRATDTKALEESFQQVVDDLERTLLHGGGAYTNYTELFAWFLVPALGLLLAEVLLSVTRLRRFP
jgi:Ca-activated chloride channel family protein